MNVTDKTTPKSAVVVGLLALTTSLVTLLAYFDARRDYVDQRAVCERERLYLQGEIVSLRRDLRTVSESQSATSIEVGNYRQFFSYRDLATQLTPRIGQVVHIRGVLSFGKAGYGLIPDEFEGGFLGIFSTNGEWKDADVKLRPHINRKIEIFGTLHFGSSPNADPTMQLRDFFYFDANELRIEPVEQQDRK